MFIEAPDFFSGAIGVSKIDWTFDDPASSNLSAYTGKRTIATNPWRSTVSAHVELCPIPDDGMQRALGSFFRRCRGQAGVFRLFATIGPQNGNAGVTVAAAASAGDTTLQLTGYDVSLLEGQFATVNGQLLQLVADQVGDTITFEGMLRQNAAAGTPIETARPYALVYLASSSRGWSITGPAVFGITFDVVEAVGETDGATTAGSSSVPTFDTTVVSFDSTAFSFDEAA